MPKPALRPSRGPKPTRTDPRHLLDAALAVFAQAGLQGASVRAIARQAGCDPALIYYHFASKEAMFAALLEDRFPPLVAELGQVAQGPGPTAEKLWRILAILHGHFHASAGFRAMIRGEIVRGAAGIQDLLVHHLAPAQQAIRAILAEGQVRGDLRADLDPVFLGFFLVRMEFEILDLIPALSQRLAGLPADVALPRAEHAWFGLFWRGVAARPDAPLPFLSPATEAP